MSGQITHLEPGDVDAEVVSTAFGEIVRLDPIIGHEYIGQTNGKPDRRGKPARAISPMSGEKLKMFTVAATATPKGRKGRRQMRDLQAKATKALLAAYAPPEDDLGDLDAAGSRGRHGKWGPGWGPVGAYPAAHQTSTQRVGVLLPTVAAANDAAGGPIVGVNTRAMEAFTFDPWEASRHGLVTSPHMAVCGMMNNGKSMAMKILACRLITFGRQVIVTSDIKSEWAKIARAMNGGQVIRIGPGSDTVLCPLDVGSAPAGVSAAEWRRIASARRLSVLRTMLSILRDRSIPDVLRADQEVKALDWCIAAMGSGRAPATIASLVNLLEHPDPDLVRASSSESVHGLWTVYSRLVGSEDEPFAGMFDGPSNVQIDPTAPMVVIDNSAIYGADKVLAGLTRAVTSTWVQTVLGTRDEAFRFLLAEECWEELAFEDMVDMYDELMRLYGMLRVAVCFVFHEPKDITRFGEAGSAHRNKVAGLVAKTETKVLFKQTSESVAVLRDELMDSITTSVADELPRLQRAIALWCIGSNAPVPVKAIASQLGYDVFNTDDGRH